MIDIAPPFVAVGEDGSDGKEKMDEYLVTIEVRLLVKATSEGEARFRAIAELEAPFYLPGEIELKGYTVVCCTNETQK